MTKHGKSAMKICMAGALALAAACATTTSNTTAKGRTAPDDATIRDGDRIVTADGRVLLCREEARTGSSIPQRVCVDEEEAEQRRQGDQAELRRREMLNRTAGSNQ